jgi:DNA-binding CsgD family transcriptional regulator/sugar-specific transcriptional regulator TrmB
MVYRTMLAEPSAGIDELCKRCDLAEDRVRATLDELVRLTLARESLERPGWLRPVSPDVAVSTLLRREERELARRQQELEDRKVSVSLAVAEYATRQSSHPGSEAERLIGLDAIQARLEALGQEVTTDCLSVMPGGAQSQASLDASRRLDQEAMSRGVVLMTLYQHSVRNDPRTYAYARWMTELGGQVRTAPVVPPRMLIFDRRIALVPIDPANTKLGALCTAELAIVASLVMIYEQAWNGAVPLGAAADPDEGTGLSAQERELLVLLASGLTDEAAGNRLAISARTVRRLMSALMERLGAASRFEAGLKAAQRGWLLARPGGCWIYR